MNDRRSLYHRKMPLAVDVADAIANLVASDDGGLPIALNIEQITIELVRIQSIDDDGDATILPAASQSAVLEKWNSHLWSSSVFKAGYKHYESRSRNQVVPVTAFFFKHVYTDEARDCLEAMSDFEIKKSLPARPSEFTDADGNPLDSDDDDHDGKSGKTAGVVVYPMNYKVLVDGKPQGPRLIGVWLRRSAGVAVGVAEAVVERLGYASKSLRVDRAKESVRLAGKDMIAALPSPKPKSKQEG